MIVSESMLNGCIVFDSQGVMVGKNKNFSHQDARTGQKYFKLTVPPGGNVKYTSKNLKSRT